VYGSTTQQVRNVPAMLQHLRGRAGGCEPGSKQQRACITTHIR
jgi:hypothetical protein